MRADSFTAWDYVVFAAVLLCSLAIGLYHAIKAARSPPQSTRQFLQAGRSMGAFPVALSMLASFFSASTLLGTPAEVYMHGSSYWWSVLGAMLAPLCGAALFGPLFYRLDVLSVNEYLEMRYKMTAVRHLGAILFIIRTVIGMGIVLFGPAVALNAVTSFPVWAAIITIGTICALYTCLGGMKAVIWTDVFQTFIMIAGMLTIIIQASIDVGGLSSAWRIADEGGRIQKLDFSVDPRVRHTFWSLTIGNFFVWLLPYTVDQQMVQRYSSARSPRDATLMLLLNAPGMMIIISLCCLCGVVMFAYYANCDPLLQGAIDDPNQLLPRMVLDTLGFAPGLPGLFTAALFSGALSSVSSMLNSLSAVTWQDFLSGLFGDVTDATSTLITKLLVLVYGLVAIGMAFLFSGAGGTVLEMSLTFNGATGSPLVGIFVLSAFFPCANALGAIGGAVAGFVLTLWIALAASLTDATSFAPSLNRTTDGCPGNLSLCSDLFTSGHFQSNGPLEDLYSISYLWLSTIGTLTTVIVGLLLSLVIGITKFSYYNDRNPKYFISITKCCCCFNRREEITTKVDKVDENTSIFNQLQTRNFKNCEDHFNGIHFNSVENSTTKL